MSGDHKGAAAAAAEVPRDFLKSLPANAFTPRPVKVAATQMACGLDTAANVDKAEALVRKAAAQGAQIILIQELFEAVYWCQDQEGKLFDLAKPASLTENPLLARFSALSEELNVVLPLSFFERANQAHYNSLIVFDAGKPLGLYRKSHIPDGPGYQEKFYFNPGDTGFKVFNTRFGAIGVAICWDQWFPEAARCMALAGAELLFYPTAIGSEPQDSTLDSRHHWTRVMQGHAGANLVPVIASNRIGKEKDITFYGNSFIADSTGHLVAQASDNKEEILIAAFDLEANRLKRQSWGVFRDRRPDLYAPITSLDGRTQVPGAVAAAARAVAPAPALPDFMGWKPHGSVAAAAAAVKAAAAAGKPTATCNGTDAMKEDLSTPAKDGFRMPAEWEPHAATWLLWPHRPDNWRGSAAPARAAFAQVIAAIAKHEPVNVCARSEDWLACKQQLSGVPRVRVLEMASDDAWMRDIGPTFVRSDATGEVRGVDWQFNAWGGDHGGCYKSWAQDQAVKAKVLDVCGAQRYVSRLVMEGGSFHTDGEGTLLTTEECLLNPNRNPTCTRADIERELRVMLGIEKVLWLPKGVYKDEDTNGHIDNLACFAAPAKVLLTWTDDAKDPQHAISTEALRILQSATDAKGRKLQVVKLLQPTPIIRTAADVQGLVDLKLAEPRAVGERLAGSYVNFYIANGAIVVPAFGDAVHDAAAKKTLEAVFPDRVVEQVAMGREILLGGGNIHCITQQQPAGRCAL